VAALALGACGKAGGGPTGPPAASLVATTTAVQVDPPSGPVGTLFTLTSRGLPAGDTVVFEIGFPGEGRAFPGAALAVGADGSATTTYRATTANPAGDYTVRVTTGGGMTGDGRFTLTNGALLTPTTARSSTTARKPAAGGPTTTAKAGGATTTTKPKAAPTTTTAATPTTASTTPTTGPRTPTT